METLPDTLRSDIIKDLISRWRDTFFELEKIILPVSVAINLNIPNKKITNKNMACSYEIVSNRINAVKNQLQEIFRSRIKYLADLLEIDESDRIENWHREQSKEYRGAGDYDPNKNPYIETNEYIQDELKKLENVERKISTLETSKIEDYYKERDGKIEEILLSNQITNEKQLITLLEKVGIQNISTNTFKKFL